jgi:hypothetical protein
LFVSLIFGNSFERNIVVSATGPPLDIV